MQTYRGTHGTSWERATSIMQTGFDPSKVGRAGEGAYLWAYSKDVSLARRLAIGWFQYHNKRGDFGKCVSCGVLHAEIAADDDEFFDCTTLEFVEALVAYLEDFTELGDEVLSSAYEVLIKRFESLMECTFSVIQAKVTPPPKIAFREHMAVGHPLVFVVRNSFDRLRVTEIEQLAA